MHPCCICPVGLHRPAENSLRMPLTSLPSGDNVRAGVIYPKHTANQTPWAMYWRAYSTSGNKSPTPYRWTSVLNTLPSSPGPCAYLLSFSMCGSHISSSLGNSLECGCSGIHWIRNSEGGASSLDLTSPPGEQSGACRGLRFTHCFIESLHLPAHDPRLQAKRERPLSFFSPQADPGIST